MSLTPRQFLLETPRGAYTTIYVKDGSLLFDWPVHLERLVRSLRALHAAIGGFYARYYEWLQETGTPEPAALQQLVAPAIREALKTAKGAESAAGDVMLIIVLPPAPAQPSGLDVCAHAHTCGPAGSSAGTAVILGGPRSVPVGKDSGWVAERRPLEQQKPGGAAEVLLCTQDGRLLEGLVTNLFVVTFQDGAAETSGNSSGGSNASPGSSGAVPVVWTAGMQDGVVWGTIRARVAEACRQLGIELREEAPSMHSRELYREAFLTNSLRIVQPLQSIACGAGNVWGHAPWTISFPEAPGPITAALHLAVLSLLPKLDAGQLD